MEVRKYIDGNGRKYKVMPGLGDSNFKARSQHPDKHGDVGWKGYAKLPWRKTFEEAQADLDKRAAERGWALWDGVTDG